SSCPRPSLAAEQDTNKRHEQDRNRARTGHGQDLQAQVEMLCSPALPHSRCAVPGNSAQASTRWPCFAAGNGKGNEPIARGRCLVSCLEERKWGTGNEPRWTRTNVPLLKREMLYH